MMRSRLCAAVLILSLIFSGPALFACDCENGPFPGPFHDPVIDGPGGTEPPETEPADLSVLPQKHVLVLRANADEGLSDPLASRLSDAGADVTVLSFSDLSAASDFSFADLLILDAGDLYYAPAENAYRAYFESGKPVLSLGDDPLAYAAVRANGRYVSPADLLASGDIVEDFATASPEDFEIAGSGNEANPASHEIRDAEDGSGRYFAFNTGFEMKQASLTFPAELSGHNALCLNLRCSPVAKMLGVILELRDGSRWSATVTDSRPETDFYPFLLRDTDFTRVGNDSGAEGTPLCFDDVTSVSIGIFSELKIGEFHRPTLLFDIGKIVALDIEESDVRMNRIKRNPSDLRHLLFPTSYECYYAESSDHITIETGISNLSGRCFTLLVRGDPDRSGFAGLKVLRQFWLGRLDATQLEAFAWAVKMQSGAVRAAIGTEDRKYWDHVGTADALALACMLLEPATGYDTPGSYLSNREAEHTLRVSCVGDSITEGVGSSGPNTYPEQLARIRGPLQLQTTNFGVGGTTAIRKYGYPYWDSPCYGPSLEAEADYVVLMFGANDVTQWTGGGSAASPADYESLVLEYLNLPCHPVVILGLSIPRFDDDAYNLCLRGEFRDIVLAVAEKYHLPVIDFYPAFEGHCNDYFAEYIHPNNAGYGVFADLVYEKICEIEGVSR